MVGSAVVAVRLITVAVVDVVVTSVVVVVVSVASAVELVVSTSAVVVVVVVVDSLSCGAGVCSAGAAQEVNRKDNSNTTKVTKRI